MSDYQTEQQELSLVDLFLIIKKYFFFLVAITLLGGLLAGIYAYTLAPKTYETNINIMVNGQHQSIKDFLLSDAVVYRALAEVNRLDLYEDIGENLTITFATASAYMGINLKLSEPNQTKRIIYQIIEVGMDLAENDPLYATYKGRITLPNNIVSEEKTAPNELLVIVIGILLSGTIGVGFVFLREMIHPRFQSKEKLEKELEIDCLGTVKRIKDPIHDEIPTYDDTTQSLIRANLDGKYKVINIIPTSKKMMGALVATNIANVMGNLGKKVLVIDLNFRQPVLEIVLGVDSHMGLTDYLFGGKTKEEIISKHPHIETDYILAGDEIESVTSVLSSKRLADLLISLESAYEYILLISPYQKGMKDSIAISQLAHVDLFVVSAKYSNKTEVKEQLSRFKKSDSHLLATILIDSVDRERLLGVPLVRI